MLKIISHFWTIPMVLLAAVFVSGCQTQNTNATGGATTNAVTQIPVPSADSTAGATVVAAASTTASTEEVKPFPELVLTNGAYRVKAGRDTAFTDSQGRVWQADIGFSGGDTTDRDPGTKIVGTKDPDMFMTEHYGMEYFACRIPNGNYTANLYFAETYDGIDGPGSRVFSFNVQGHPFKDFDVWVKAGGPYKPYVVTVPVEVTNGVFRVDFSSKIENPEINAIEIIPST